ncbi:MAG: phosphotransferase, partial [Thermoactinospora sp.]|nr:phosphotransferase [Thermoactinospora sp.]
MPLRSLRITPEHVTAMAAAVEALHACPAAGVPRRSGEPLEMVAWLHDRCTDPAVLAWLDSPGLEHLLDAEPEPVIGTGDGNLANFLWDGERIRLIDFEHAGRCDRAYDLAEIVEHVSLSFPASWLLSHFSYSA